MSYCSSHNKLAESKNLCMHCSSSRPADNGRMNDVSSTVAFFTWMSESASEDEENRCSCCDQILNAKVYPHSLIFNPSWDVLLECLHKNKIEFEADPMKKKIELQENGRGDDANDDEKAFQKEDGGRKKAEIVEESVCDSNLEVREWNSSQTTDDPFWNLGCNEDDESVYIADMLLQNAELMDSDRFICIELIDTDAEREMPLTNSSQDIDDTVERSSRLTEEHERRGDNTENLVNPSREIDGAEASGVEEPEKLSEDFNLAEPDNCVEAVGVSIQPRSSETESLVNDSSKTSHESSDIDEATSEIEGGVESLRSVIESQEKALNAVYTELEEERKAAAEAAKETMAMISKIEEEKAAMQMEAVQYQRMMEEQAEYDQEALQLLNDLMLKREKEKRELEKEKKELEKELEIYRCKALIRTASSSNNSIDLDCSQDYLDDSLTEMEETGVECISNSISYIPADISLAEFDEERLSILEELKVLEAKLFALHDDEAQAQQRLLPLFDAAENEDHDTEEIISYSYNGNVTENGKILIHEELGHVYERLQALEADKDFLNHCIRSMMKGNQGMPLLQEILQHLRDLKSVQLSATNLAHIPYSEASMAKEDHQGQD